MYYYTNINKQKNKQYQTIQWMDDNLESLCLGWMFDGYVSLPSG